MWVYLLVLLAPLQLLDEKKKKNHRKQLFCICIQAQSPHLLSGGLLWCTVVECNWVHLVKYCGVCLLVFIFWNFLLHYIPETNIIFPPHLSDSCGYSILFISQSFIHVLSSGKHLPPAAFEFDKRRMMYYLKPFENPAGFADKRHHH